MADQDLMLPLLPQSHCRSVPKLPVGWHVWRLAILSDGGLGIAGADQDLEACWKVAAAEGFATGKLELKSYFELAHQSEIRLFSVAGGRLNTGPSLQIGWYHAPLFDRFSDGNWLVVTARAGEGPNARVIRPDETEENRFRLGDGIEHLGIDGQDRIWVGWFDEGVFGNQDWKLPGPAQSVTIHGAGAFSREGAYLAVPCLSGYYPVDCYALNVHAEGAWMCAYSRFELVDMQVGHAGRIWQNGTHHGASALAFGHGHALLASGYGDELDHVTLLKLEQGDLSGHAIPVAQWRLPLSSDAKPILLSGRGARLDLVDAGLWYHWDIADLIAAARD
jgi:hypothetical protein